MKAQHRILSMLLSVVFILPFFMQKPISVSAASEVLIKSPQPSDTITDQYILRYAINNSLNPQKIVIAYRNLEGGQTQVETQPNGSSTETTSYETLIQQIGAGVNTISVTATAQDGTMYTDQRTVTVDHTLTNIHSDEPNIQPYVTDKNKFKNLLKQSNQSAATEKGKIAKDNAYISRFVDLLFEEAALEKVRPDIVFAQIMLETGWLTFGYTVRENQNNLGGLGATGDGVRGNVFKSLQEGIRANVQHLVAYASTRALNAPRVDPRFYFLEPHGVAPYVEYLGFMENLNGKGWAMGFQYGYKLRNIISRLDQSSAAPLALTAPEPVITELEVSSITRGTTYNPNNINLKPGFAVGLEVRMGIASNSDTEQRFIITNTTTGETQTTPWSEDRAQFFTPKSDGLYEFKSEIRLRGKTTVAGFKSQQVQIGQVIDLPEDPDEKVEPVIGNMILSSSPYYPGKTVTLTLEAISGETLRVNEYMVETEHAGKTSLLSSWSTSPIYQYTPSGTGEHLIRVYSRNRLIGGDAIHSAYVTIRVVSLDEPKNLMLAAGASPDRVELGQTASIQVTPVTNPGFEVEYRLMLGSAAQTAWSTLEKWNYTPAQSGTLALNVQARRKGGNGTILDSQALSLIVTEPAREGIRQIEWSSAPYVKGSGVTAKVVPYSSLEPNEFRLFVKEGTAYLPLTKWQTQTSLSFVPAMTGTVELAVKAKNKVTGKETAYIHHTINVASSSVTAYGPTGYVPENPQSVALNGLYIAGIRAKDRNLEINVPPASSLEYRYYVVSESTGQRSLVKDWSPSTRAVWKSVYGYFTVVVEARHISSRTFYDTKISESIVIKNYPTVFLDPGHGGSDRGVVAIRSGITYAESTLTLAMAQAVRARLAGRGVNVFASRSANVFVSMDNRVAMANQKAADLFVSFHYNKSSYSTTKGIRTYYSGRKSDPLANLYLPESSEAAALLGPKAGYYYTVNKGTTTDLASLGYTMRILRETKMPAVQLNLGYISNYDDLTRIRSAWYRDKIAAALADGIMAYLNQN